MFSIGQTVTVPTTVHPSGKAVIVGMEWGPNNKSAGPSWVYYLRLCAGPAWLVREDELVKWGNG